MAGCIYFISIKIGQLNKSLDLLINLGILHFSLEISFRFLDFNFLSFYLCFLFKNSAFLEDQSAYVQSTIQFTPAFLAPE